MDERRASQSRKVLESETAQYTEGVTRAEQTREWPGVKMSNLQEMQEVNQKVFGWC